MTTIPVYLVIDVSASLSGRPIDDLNNALSTLVTDLAADPILSGIVQISVIAFSSDARVVSP